MGVQSSIIPDSYNISVYKGRRELIWVRIKNVRIADIVNVNAIIKNVKIVDIVNVNAIIKNVRIVDIVNVNAIIKNVRVVDIVNVNANLNKNKRQSKTLK
ncbi:hypothetical protein ASG99_12030 [Bacillus sp. Soil768D1]|nr:hypothetical protein ASG99_12030 [Bacillus sp. Soil768D1]